MVCKSSCILYITNVISTIYHILKVLSVEDTLLHVNDHMFEAKFFLGNWCYNMNIGQLESISLSVLHF